jgi:hypothetical protein
MAPKQKKQLAVAVGLLVVVFAAVYMLFLRGRGQTGTPPESTAGPSGAPGTTSAGPGGPGAPPAPAPTAIRSTGAIPAPTQFVGGFPPVPANLPYRDDPFKSFAPPVVGPGTEERPAAVWFWGLSPVTPKPPPPPEVTRLVEVVGGPSVGRRVSGIVSDGRVWAIIETETDTGLRNSVVRPGDLVPAFAPGGEQPRVVSITPDGVNLRSEHGTIFVPLRSLERPTTPVPTPTPGVRYPTAPGAPGAPLAPRPAAPAAPAEEYM